MMKIIVIEHFLPVPGSKTEGRRAVSENQQRLREQTEHCTNSREHSTTDSQRIAAEEHHQTSKTR